ncbi:putative SOS response-associated peptidase YedK [Arthrobacter silviterrae]|uniref:Abasic site processing protein n=1 Tax=Arthrobacter silviterrae TaxID=2026658 RepID=A0ABX0DDN0_9MICC|nr:MULTISPECIES: SOS response-associated peptidase [Arthrobacter]MCU6478822.1 SOS response-associated peptidase [Arthrobacter sp. A2-55]MDQ0276346.1 putative SOS response-associated peptidase YedK [Arthrobacter silviterrae]NGN82473.1 SOS response-associated peptidase [Arthrobacter silviterrae]
MCGRYVMARAVGDLVAELEAEADENLELRASWNVAPTSDVPIVLERLVDGVAHRQVHVAKWGLVPRWAKDASVGVWAFNARTETVLEKPTFRTAAKSRRCAVPVEGYYEWKKLPGGAKQPYFVHNPGGRLISFAGLYEWWKDPALADGDPGQWLLSCTILTMASPPDGELATLHDRLPVPLGQDTLGEWLDPGNTTPKTVLDAVLAESYSLAAGWVLDLVGPEVGNVRNDSPELMARQA